MKIKLSKKFYGDKTLIINRQKTRCTGLDEKGFVLVVSLILLLVVTIMGVLALSSSTTEVMIAGNQRIVEMNHVSADGGKKISRPVIEDVVYYDRVDKNTFAETESIFEIDDSLNNELQINDSNDDGTENTISVNHDDETNAHDNPDILFALPANDPQNTVRVDIDYLFAALAAGSAIEFASGTEGTGKGVSNAGAHVYYKVNSFSKGDATGTGAEVGSLYRYVMK